MQVFANIIALFMQPAGSHCGIIKELDYDGPALLDKLHSFCRLRNELLTPVSCFYELYPTDYGRKKGGIGGVVKGMVCSSGKKANRLPNKLPGSLRR
jgi:hypothetical protein